MGGLSFVCPVDFSEHLHSLRRLHSFPLSPPLAPLLSPHSHLTTSTPSSFRHLSRLFSSSPYHHFSLSLLTLSHFLVSPRAIRLLITSASSVHRIHTLISPPPLPCLFSFPPYLHPLLSIFSPPLQTHFTTSPPFSLLLPSLSSPLPSLFSPPPLTLLIASTSFPVLTP